jgi:hypothetical protein
MNISIVQNIRTLHVQIPILRLKYTPSTSLCRVDVKNELFVVAKYLPINIKRV